MKIYEKILLQIKQSLPRIIQEKKLMSFLSNLNENFNISPYTRKKLLSKATKVPLVWSREPKYSFITFFENYHIMELICAFSHSNYYLSHYPALYWNECIEQKPETFYLSKEAPNRTPQHSEYYNFDLVKQTFMKSPRYTNYFVKHKNTKLFLIEKQNLFNSGIIEKKIKINNRNLSFKLTNIERTLIDSIISPHYSGGLLTIINIFQKIKINMRDLYDYYTIYDPFYPYWQSIGLILEKTKGKVISDEWKSYFTDDMKKFFIDKGYKSTWKYSKTWKIYYPEGIF